MGVSQRYHLEASACGPLERYEACKFMARGYAAEARTDSVRLARARAFCCLVLHSLWQVHAGLLKSRMGPPRSPVSHGAHRITKEAKELAASAGEIIAQFPVADAGYLVGSIYTVMLPPSYRSQVGAYYTPPPLVSRLLEQAESAGFDFSTGNVIDPACGGGAFLAPTAMRMADSMRQKGGSDEWIFAAISQRLRGIEIDPFAAWMSHTLLELSLLPLCKSVGKRLPQKLIVIGDALEQKTHETFGLVIGNPPYGRVKLSLAMRNKFKRSLFGHANLYGLFTDLAVRLCRQGGVIAFVTPTSFLGGQYFMALRELLSNVARPASFDFISDREGVFDDVLQETLLACFRKEVETRSAEVSLLVPNGLHSASVQHLSVISPVFDSAPWIIPRSKYGAALLGNLGMMGTRLSDVGFRVSTGQLVWNRHKSQLRSAPGDGVKPLIWAESVFDGEFRFSYQRRSHQSYIKVESGQEFLIVDKECVLVQRTTSKEQDKRLQCAVLPQRFINKACGVVVENHLNMVIPEAHSEVKVGAKTICALLNSRVVDEIFRCISGSVAVSAYELGNLPLPSVNQLIELQQAIKKGFSKDSIEALITKYYGGV